MPVLRPSPSPLSRERPRELVVPASAQPVAEPGTPPWWRDRLYGRLLDKQDAIGLYRDYYDGHHDLKFATQKFHEAFGNQFREFADNLCPLVVDSAAQRLQVQGFRFAGGEDADRVAWELWQRNALDAEAALLHHETVKVGEGYALVSPGDDPAWPRITVEDPAQCEVEFDPADRRRRLAGLKCWTDPESNLVQATLWLPDAIHRWAGVASRSTGRVTWYDRDEPAANELGVVPLVAFLNAPGLYGGRSDLENVIPLMRALNKTCLDMTVTGEFNSYRQRIFSGIGEIRDQNGQVVDNFEEILGSSRILTIPGDGVQVHDLTASDPGLYIKVLHFYAGQIAAVSSTPLPYMNVEGSVFPASGEALKVAEVALVAKDRRKTVDLGESWEEVARLAFLVRGDVDRGNDFTCETIWSDLESRTDSQRVDALVKLKDLGLPRKALWKMIPGATEATVARWIEEAEEEARDAPLGGGET